MIAAEIRNTTRSEKGQKVWTWQDFVPEGRAPTKLRSARMIAFEFDRAAEIFNRQGIRR